MPELPEVETIRRQLVKKIIGKKLNGQKIVDIRRRGKILMVDFAEGSSLVFHLKLAGQLIFNGKPTKYTRKVFNFDDGSQLIFNDVRKFAWWKKVKTTKEIEKELGPEALEITFETFKTLLKKHPKIKIKPLLMNQKFIAGIGNIYSDEILFASKVKPMRQAKTLSEKEIQNVFQDTKKILKTAIKYQGSSIQHYLDAYGRKGNYSQCHKVYHQNKCSLCGAGIKTTKINGRTAHYCPKCQK